MSQTQLKITPLSDLHLKIQEQCQEPIIAVGDTIKYRYGFGMGPVVEAKVIGMEVTGHSREKYGNDVDWCVVSLVKANRCCFTLDDGHWCYSEQVIL